MKRENNIQTLATPHIRERKRRTQVKVTNTNFKYFDINKLMRIEYNHTATMGSYIYVIKQEQTGRQPNETKPGRQTINKISKLLWTKYEKNTYLRIAFTRYI